MKNKPNFLQVDGIKKLICSGIKGDFARYAFDALETFVNEADDLDVRTILEKAMGYGSMRVVRLAFEWACNQT